MALLVARYRNDIEYSPTQVELHVLPGPVRDSEQGLDGFDPFANDDGVVPVLKLAIASHVVSVAVRVADDEAHRLTASNLLPTFDNIVDGVPDSIGPGHGTSVLHQRLFIAQEEVNERGLVVDTLVLTQDPRAVVKSVHLNGWILILATILAAVNPPNIQPG